MHGTVVLLQKEKKSVKSSKNTQAVVSSLNASSVSWTSRVKPNSLRQISRPMQKQLSVLVSDDQLSVGRRWESV